MRAYVGLDIHSKSSTYVVQDARGEELGRGAVPTSPEGLAEMKGRLHLEAGTEVGVESGTMAFYVARQVRALELKPVVIDAHEVRLKAHRPRQKSDERDARELCIGVRTGLYRSIVHVPSEAVLLLRETLSRRRHFVRIQTGEINAAKRVLRSSGYRTLGRKSLTTDGAWKRVVKEAAEADGTRTFVDLHFQAWRAAGERVRDLEQNLETQVTGFEPAYSRLRTVPGVGNIVAATALAFLSEPGRFGDAKHAASYAGLVPQMDQSGDVHRGGHITKGGPAELRAMLCEASHQAARRSNPLNPLLLKLSARLGSKKAITALTHRLCRVVYAILRDGTEFDPARLGLEKGPFQVTRTKMYRLRKVPPTKR